MGTKFPLTFVYFCHDSIILWKQESYFDIDFIVWTALSSNLEIWFSKTLVTEPVGTLSQILKLTGWNVWHEYWSKNNTRILSFIIFFPVWSWFEWLVLSCTRMSETFFGEWNFIPTLRIIHIWQQPKNQEILTIVIDQKYKKNQNVI